MRIIEKGTLPNEEKECSCPKCHTKFAYNPGDVSVDRDSAYVICPLPGCNAFITVR
jgi:hypothetical protein